MGRNITKIIISILLGGFIYTLVNAIWYSYYNNYMDINSLVLIFIISTCVACISWVVAFNIKRTSNMIVNAIKSILVSYLIIAGYNFFNLLSTQTNAKIIFNVISMNFIDALLLIAIPFGIVSLIYKIRKK